jgi:hypothetical protein
MGCYKSVAVSLMNTLEYVQHNAYQNRKLTHQHVFMLHHEHHTSAYREDTKLLGVYSSHEAAQQQIELVLSINLALIKPMANLVLIVMRLAKTIGPKVLQLFIMARRWMRMNCAN